MRIRLSFGRWGWGSNDILDAIEPMKMRVDFGSCAMIFRRDVVILICVLGLLGWLIWPVLPPFLMPEILPHEGDGNFENLSIRNGVFALPAYQISMSQVDLGQPLQTEYRVKHLPSFKNAGCFLRFAVTDDEEYAQQTVETLAHIAITVEDSNGNVIRKSETKLNRATVSSYHALKNQWSKFIEVYLFNSGFAPDYDKEYWIKIYYTADPKLAGNKGFLLIDCQIHH